MAGFNGVADAGVLHKDDIVNNLTSTATTAPLSANMGKALNANISIRPIIKKVNISGTTDGNGDIGITGLSQATYPIAFLAGENSSDVVTFFDGSQTTGYQKYAHFDTKKSVTVSGEVVYLEGPIST